MRTVRIASGAIIWVLIVGALWYTTRGVTADGQAQSPAVRGLIQFASGERDTAKLQWTRYNLDVEVGDPIFILDGPDQTPRQVGEIQLLNDPDTGEPTRRAYVKSAQALFYASVPNLTADAQVIYYNQGRSVDWVLKTMLPPEKRQEIAAMIKAAYEQHHEEILAELLPLVQKSLREASQVVERDLPKALARHREHLVALGRKYQKDIVEEKIAPLVKQEIWPIVQQHAKPMAEEVGVELWKKLPKWGLAWRKGVDYVPFTRGTRARDRFSMYIDKEAMPVLEDRAGDFVAVVQKIMKDAAKNDKVRNVLRSSVTEMVKDPQLQEIVWTIVREVIVDNPNLQKVLVKNWTGPEAKAALSNALSRVDPTLNDIGHLLFGKRGKGFTPEFARVLRARVMRKDRRWFVLQLPAKSSTSAAATPPRDAELVLPVQWGGEASIDPFLDALAHNAVGHPAND